MSPSLFAGVRRPHLDEIKSRGARAGPLGGGLLADRRDLLVGAVLVEDRLHLLLEQRPVDYAALVAPQSRDLACGALAPRHDAEHATHTRIHKTIATQVRRDSAGERDRERGHALQVERVCCARDRAATRRRWRWCRERNALREQLLGQLLLSGRRSGSRRALFLFHRHTTLREHIIFAPFGRTLSSRSSSSAQLDGPAADASGRFGALLPGRVVERFCLPIGMGLPYIGQLELPYLCSCLLTAGGFTSLFTQRDVSPKIKSHIQGMLETFFNCD